jgi:hypothetical protein
MASRSNFENTLDALTGFFGVAFFTAMSCFLLFDV